MSQFTSEFPSLRLLSRAALSLGLALVSACGDDVKTLPGTFNGSDAGAQSSASAANSSVSGDAGSGLSCSAVQSQCASYDDTNGLGNLCLRIASEQNAEACSAISDECAAYCRPNGELPSGIASLDAETCDEAIGDPCHEFDQGAGLGHWCHELGHQGNLAGCAALYAECVALCGGPEQPSHAEHDAGADAGERPAPDAGVSKQAVTLQFRGTFGAKDFACNSEYSAIGTASSKVTPQDFRFYVSGVQLVTQSGEVVDVELDERAPFQGGGVALLDFEDGTGACNNGNAALNSVVTGKVPVGTYKQVRFSTSVPSDLNHGDPTTLPAPLQAGGMSWGWLYGYRFLKAELQLVVPATSASQSASASGTASASATSSASATASASVSASSSDSAAPSASASSSAVASASLSASASSSAPPHQASTGGAVFHLGSTGCSNQAASSDDNFNAPPATACQNANRNLIELDHFDLAHSVIVADVAQLFSTSDLETGVLCHSSGSDCSALFAQVGVDYASGSAAEAQSFFRLE